MRWTFGWRAASPVLWPRTRDGRPIGRPSRCFACSGAVRLQAELPDEALELLRGAGELLRGRCDLLRRGARLLRGGRDLLRGGRGLLGDRGDLGHVAPDLLRARRDLLDRCGDLLDPAVHVLDGRAERQERLARLLDRGDAVLGPAGAVLDDLDGLGRLGLDLADQPGDRPGRGLALLGQLADLLGHHGKAAALLTGARRLDRRVQRQQIRLLGDPGDRRDDPLDLLGLRAQLTDRLGRLQRRIADRAHRLRRLRDRARALLGDLAGRGGGLSGLLRIRRADRARRRDLLGRELRLLHRAHLTLGALGDLAHGRGDLADGATGLLGGGRHLLRGGRQRLSRARHVADERAELRARLVVALDRLDHLGLDVVEGAADVADLVAGGVLDLRGLRLDGLRQVAGRHRLDRVGEARDAHVAQHLQALDDDLERADDRRDDHERETDGDERRDERGDDDRLAAARGGRAGARLRPGDRSVALADQAVAALRDGVDGGNDLRGVEIARAVALLDVLHGLLPRAADGRGDVRVEGVVGGLEARDLRLRVGLVDRCLQARDLGLAALREGGDLLGHAVLDGELAVVDVEVAGGQVRRALHVGLEVEDVLLRDHVVVRQRLRAVLQRADLRDRDRGDDDERQDHRAERDAEAVRESQVVETRHSLPPGKAGGSGGTGRGVPVLSLSL